MSSITLFICFSLNLKLKCNYVKVREYNVKELIHIQIYDKYSKKMFKICEQRDESSEAL